MTHTHNTPLNDRFCCDVAPVSRRSFVAGLTASLGVGLMPTVSFANMGDGQDNRFVLIILRGGMDALNTIVPYADPHYAPARKHLALNRPNSGADSVLDLDGYFGLNPALKPLHSLYQQGEMAVVHACSTPYRSRSHFDGQDLFENGTDNPLGRDDGWLNRALALLSTDSKHPVGLSMGNTTPYVMRGDSHFLSLNPGAGLEHIGADTIKRLQALYEMPNTATYGNGDMAMALEQALASSDLLNSLGAGKKQREDSARQLAQMAGETLGREQGARLATLSLGGWDTHADQTPLLNDNLQTLATVITQLKRSLGKAWGKTTVVCVSEFGRMVYANGTDGTDHGTGGAMILAGGALNGGKIYGNWPTLNPKKLYEGRDITPTTDVRSVMAEILHRQFALSKNDLESKIFPGVILNPLNVV